MSEPIIAKQDVPVRCTLCECRIDKGDRYVILAWPRGSGFDYVHADCNDTSMLDHVRGKAS